VSTFVSVGNALQPFSRLLDAVARHADAWPQPVIVQFGHTQFSFEKSVAYRFLDMPEFSRMVEQAELLVMHAGAGSVIHAIHAGKLPVVMPRRVRYGEHIDDHQLEFSHALASMNRVILAEEPEDLPAAVSNALVRAVNRQVSAEPVIVGLVREALDDYARNGRRGR
jgi:UDP-N-acetylglucosamine transferase subunit ALG13